MDPAVNLREWVSEHRVTWELSPWQEMVDHQATAVGFELRLFARHNPGTRADPGLRERAQLYEVLRGIALSVLPKESRPTCYEVQPFDASLHMRPEAHWEPEGQLRVHITHRERYLMPVDECEKRCADEIQQGLRDLGAQPRSWCEGPRT